jgi:exo-poly-alpha-galacturonosidase
MIVMGLRRYAFWGISGSALAALALGRGLQAAEPDATAKGEQRYVISAHGAVGDGMTLNTRAIQTAIDRCAADGGGVVVVPEGTFLSGSVFLKQGVKLLVEKDGILRGSVDPGSYPQIPTRWEGVEREWTAALVNAIDLTGAEISGEGTVDGQGLVWWERYPRLRTQAALSDAPTLADTLGRGKPRLIAVQGCRGVRVAGLNLRNHASWCVHILYSEDVVVEDLDIRAAHTIPSSDGIDVDSSRRVRIARCFIDVNDDCITIKSGKDEDGLRVNRPSEDIVVENCRLGYGHGGVAMGSETSGGIRKVLVRDCVVEADNWAPIRFKTQPSRGGVVEDIVFRDIKLRGTRQAFELNMLWRMVPPIAPPAKVLPVFRNIHLINITGAVGSLGVLRGLKESPIEGVTFEGCKLTAGKGLVLMDVGSIDTSGLDARVKNGPVVVRQDAAEGVRR